MTLKKDRRVSLENCWNDLHELGAHLSVKHGLYRRCLGTSLYNQRLDSAPSLCFTDLLEQPRRTSPWIDDAAGWSPKNDSSMFDRIACYVIRYDPHTLKPSLRPCPS